MTGLMPSAEMPPAEQGEMASPAEQAMYDDLVTRAYDLIFDASDAKNPKTRDSILDALDDEPVKESLGMVGASVFARVLQAAQEGGVEVPGEVKEAAGAEVFETLAEIATNAKIYDFMGDDEAFQGAFLMAADQLRQMEVDTGTVTQEGAAADFEEMAAMDKDGRLAQIMAQLEGQA